MFTESYFRELVSYFGVLFLLCIAYLPMQNQLRFPPVRTLLGWLAVSSAVIFPLASVTCRSSVDTNFVLLGLTFLAFLVYNHTLFSHLSANLCSFLFACDMLSFTRNYMYIFDASLHPDLFARQVSLDAVFFQVFLNIVLILVLFYPIRRFGNQLIDKLLMPPVWTSMSAISAFFLVCNYFLIPNDYGTFHSDRARNIFWIVCTILLLLLLFIYVQFYFIAVGLMDSKKKNEHLRIMEMQESQFLAQQHYIEETRRLRHDFRHTIATLKELSDAKDYDALSAYLDEYYEQMPSSAVTRYCRNYAVNAVLNHYANRARQYDINIRWHIDLPEYLLISDNDLCSLLGNLLENGIHGCCTIPSGERYFDFTITARNNYLCIAAENPFDGKIRKARNRYLSTSKNGSGIGLLSIKVTVEKYGGTVRFYNDEHRFFSEIMMLKDGSTVNAI